MENFQDNWINRIKERSSRLAEKACLIKCFMRCTCIAQVLYRRPWVSRIKHTFGNKGSDKKFRSSPTLMYTLSVHKHLKSCCGSSHSKGNTTTFALRILYCIDIVNCVLKQYTYSTYTQYMLRSIHTHQTLKLFIIIKFPTIRIDGVNFATYNSFRIWLVYILIRKMWLPHCS